MVGAEYQGWMSKLLGFDFEIQYRSGASNRVADALSRKDEQLLGIENRDCSMLEMCQWEFWPQLKAEIDSDPFITRVLQDLAINPEGHAGFSVAEEHLLYKGRLCLPKGSASLQQVLKVYHDTAIGGHSGALKTYQRAAAEVYWPGMQTAIRDYVAQCETCQRNKGSTLAPAGLLQPLPVPVQVWDDITMDFIEGLPRSDGWDCILVVVDRLSKYAHFISLKHPFTATSVAKTFIRKSYVYTGCQGR